MIAETDELVAVPRTGTGGQDSLPDGPSDGVRIYRGRRMEDILPKIRAELGPDAIILREREGLVGGFGGFFAHRFIEVEARPGGRSIDVYDEDDDRPDTLAGLRDPDQDSSPAPLGAQAPQTDAFVARLREAAAAWTEDDAPADVRPARTAPLDAAAAAAIVGDLTMRGGSRLWASQLVSAAGAHRLPLAGSRGLRGAAQAELARRILAAPALPAGGGAIAFVGGGGSGKSRCAAALASAYAQRSTLTVSVLALGEAAAERVQERRSGGLVIIDTPATTPTDPAAIRALNAQLAPLSLDAIYVTLPATFGARAARRALAGFGALRPTAVAITHADETDQLGVAVEIAVTHRIPLAYIHAGTDVQRSLSAVDPAGIAHHLLPS